MTEILRRCVNWLRVNSGDRSRIMGLRFTTTWRCNSRCTTCSIWERPDAGKDELSLQEIDAFSRSKYFRHTRYITLSGGEPTLRQDLAAIVGTLHRNIPGAFFNITTNGLQPEQIEELFRRIFSGNPGIRFGVVNISLNGPPEVHDLTRGIPGSWEKAVQTYDRLSVLVRCQFSFTFCRANRAYFGWVQDFARSRKTIASVCWTVMNNRFNVSDEDLVFWQPGMDRVLEEYVGRAFRLPHTLKGRLRALFFHPAGITLSCLYDHIVNRRRMPCYAGRSIVHIDPQGNVYPCNFKLTADRVMGNLHQEPFDRIWEGIDKNILREISRCACMYPNGLCGDSDIYPSLCNHPPAVMRWYAGKLCTGRPLIEQRPGPTGRKP